MTEQDLEANREAAASLETKAADPNLDALLWSDDLFSVSSTTGVRISQASAMQSTAVFACVNRLSVDVGKLGFYLFRERDDGFRQKLKRTSPGLSPTAKALASLFTRPNSWQTWFEFVVQMQAGLVMRGNAYAVIISDRAGLPKMFVPINPDKVALWEGPDGTLWYAVTRTGLHQMAILANEPFLVPYESMFHLKTVSSNGLLGVAPITLGREAIGLSLAQEQLASRWMGNGARPQGILKTPNRLTQEIADRAKANWQAAHNGINNSGKVAVLENGLEWQSLSMNASDLEFIASRGYQLREIARLFNIPLHLLADPEGLAAAGKGTTPDQLAQQYFNDTITTYTELWRQRLVITFDLDLEDLDIGFDYSILTRSDRTARYNAYKAGIMGSFLTPDEARLDDGREPLGGRAGELVFPGNSEPFGSDHSGTAPDGAGHPDAGALNSDQNPK